MTEKRAPFPTNSEEFAADDRISYSKMAQTFVLEDEQGEEWEWLSGPQKWSKTMDEALMKQQAEIYKVAGVDEDAPALNPAKKRKEASLEDPEFNPKNAKSNVSASATAAAKPRQNTAVFVTGLPHDVDHEEVRDYFKAFGVIAESVDNDEKRVKLYNDANGKFKGEALVIYHRPESVQMAVYMADGALFRRQDPEAATTTIGVVEADTNFKAHKDDTAAPERAKAAKPKGSRSQAKKKADEMNARLADWSDDDVSTMPTSNDNDKKVVIIKNVFTLQKLASEPNFLPDCQEDMREMAEQYGTVKNVTIFDLEPEGIVTIRFANAADAIKFGRATDERWYDGLQLETFPSDGSEKFKKTRKAYVDKEHEEAKRLEEYSKYIEGEGQTANGGSNS